MRKLIRDQQEQCMAAPRLEFETAAKDEGADLLTRKLLEEVAELITADGRVAVLKELGDIQEILWAIGKLSSIDPIEVLMQASEKKRLAGGYDELRVMTVSTADERVLNVEVKDIGDRPPTRASDWQSHRSCYSG